MKKFILALAALSMVATPAIAGGRNHDYRWGVDSNRHSPYYGQHRVKHRDYNRGHRHNGGVSTGEAVAIGLGALILGAAISNNNRNNRVERYEQPPQRRQSQYVCQDVIQYDYYGNPYVAGRNCWYQ